MSNGVTEYEVGNGSRARHKARARPFGAGTSPSSWRVLHVAEAWNGGVGVYLEGLLRLQLEDPRFAEVHLACSSTRSPSRLLEDHPRLRIHRYDSSRSPLAVHRVARAVREIAHEVQPGLLHLHSTFAGVYGRFFASDCPVLYCAHGWAFTQDVAPPVRWAYAQVERWLARRTHALVHISQDEARAARSYGVRADEERVILHGVRPPLRSRKRELSLDDRCVNLGFVGRFDRQKGTELLLEAFAGTTRQDLRLYLLGDFDREAPRASDPLLDDRRITRLGWVPQEELDDILAALDAVVIPSRWEGFGLVAAEAMRNAKPVLVSHRGGLPEQVVHGFNGLVFSLDSPSALRELLGRLDKQVLAEMGRNARRVWESSFSEQRAYNELMEVYARLLMDRSSTAGSRE